MKKTFKEWKRKLAVMLAAAMVLTMAPQTAMPVLAGEEEIIAEEVLTEETEAEEVLTEKDENKAEETDPENESPESAGEEETENNVSSGEGQDESENADEPKDADVFEDTEESDDAAYTVTRRLITADGELEGDEIESVFGDIIDFTYTAEDDTIIFKAVLKDEEYWIAKAAYTVGDGEETDCTDDENLATGITISEVTGDVILTVGLVSAEEMEYSVNTVQETGEYEISFNTENDSKRIPSSLDVYVEVDSLPETGGYMQWNDGRCFALLGRLENGETISVSHEKVMVQYSFDYDCYSIKELKADGKLQTQNEDSNYWNVYYDITLTADKTTEITAVMQRRVHVSVSINSLDSIEVDDKPLNREDYGKRQTYTWEPGGDEQKIVFTVGNQYSRYIPVVKYDKYIGMSEWERPIYKYSVILEPKKTPENYQDDSRGTYTYEIKTSELGGYIYIYADDIKHTYEFQADEGSSLDGVNVSINGKIISADELKKKQSIYEGAKIPIRIWAKNADYVLKNVSYTVKGREAPLTIGKDGAVDTSLVISGDTVITITVPEACKAHLMTDDDKQTMVESVNGKYNVSYNGRYSMTIKKAVSGETLPIEGAALTIGKTAVAGDGVVTTDAETNKAVIDLSKVADEKTIDGKTLTLTLTAGSETFVYTLLVSKKITAASAITVPSKITQPIGTTKAYKVTTKGELAKLAVKISGDASSDDTNSSKFIDSITLVNGQLTVRTGTKIAAKEDNVKIIVYSVEDENIKKEIPLTSTSLLPAAAPKVTLKGATDIDLTLTVSAATDADVTGGVYYKVTTRAAEGETVPENLEGGEKTTYFLKSGNSQDITVNVAKAEKTYGDGGACKFNMTVSLVHISVLITEEKEGEHLIVMQPASLANIVEEGKNKQVYSTGAKPFATQKPAWETALKLKKGATTLYRGQESTLIAEAQFSKTTTYKVIDKDQVKDVTAGLVDTEKLTFETDGSRIYAMTSSAAATGKHTVRVTAKTTEGMASSNADLIVTVVRGVESIKVNVPCTSLYKVLNKSASFKATVEYNGDATGRDKNLQPKNKKKVSWELVAVEKLSNGGYKVQKNAGADVPFDDGGSLVTVKNGTVTVAKGYYIRSTEVENTFVVKATAENGVGGVTTAYSDPVTITNASIYPYFNLKKEYSWEYSEGTYWSSIGKYDGKTKAYKTTASEMNGAKIDTWNATPRDLTFKSSKPKDVEIKYSEDGTPYIQVHKANTTVTLTVTANDGSKKKSEQKWIVGYDEAERGATRTLGLKFSTLAPEKDGETATEVIHTPAGAEDASPAAIEYAGATRLLAQVVVIDKSANDDVKIGNGDEFVQYDIKVTSGGKKTSQEGSSTWITVNKQTTKIELTDKATNKKVTYTLTNTDINESKVSVKAKVQDKLHKEGTPAEQKVGVALTIPTSVNENPLYAKVDVDWTKLNAKNSADLCCFASGLKTNKYALTDLQPDAKNASVVNGTFNLDFAKDGVEKLSFNQNSYALKITVGYDKTENGKTTFVPVAPAAAATVSVEKTKKFTFKPTTTYNISTQTKSVPLTGKANIPDGDLVISYDKLYNANIKGEPNKFTEYFEISKDGKLQLKSDAYMSELQDKTNQNQLIGYLEYTADTNKTYYERSMGTGKKIVKITVKLKN